MFAADPCLHFRLELPNIHSIMAVEPNPHREKVLWGTSVIFLILPLPFVALRIWARRIQRISLCFNDYAIIGANVFTARQSR